MIYGRFAKYYDVLLSPLEKTLLSRWRAEAFSKLPIGASILEIGAGTGLNFRHYPQCRLAVATDISHPMLSVARTRAHIQTLVQADAQLLPFVDGSFDAAIATLVFCSIPDPALAFAELIRVVRPGGTVILLEHVRPPGLLGRAFDLLNLATVALIDDHFNRETAQLAAESGLEVAVTEKKAGGIFDLIVCRTPIRSS